ncbi:GntR family transcriptional regulator [Pseudonocardia acaciae]|uniref:GntR family transcriptional regulator n=1 Tax=Pseudonocardia acaciae TaxID=551276 RepID=UPI00056AB944|nr:GntR family transcriptional regulator [Pseudonocardia acaciae]
MTHDGPRSTRGYVAGALREAIITGELPPGHQLRQDQLSADFRSSAAPVREALRQLESEGLVVHYANRGSFVAEITEDELRNVLLPLRLHLERYALDRAVERDRARLCDELDQVTAEMRAAADRADLRAVTEADVRFHRTLVDAAGSAQTSQLWGSIQWRLRVQFHRLGEPAHRLHSITDEHITLVKAIRDDGRDHLHRALHEHIVTAAETLLDSA